MTAYSYPQYVNYKPQVGTFHSWWIAGSPQDGTYSQFTDRKYGENFSSSHKRDPDGKYRSGGSWISVKREVISFGEHSTTYRSGNGIAYKGPYLVVTSTDLDWASHTLDIDPADTEEHAVSYGAQAYSVLKPDHPDFSPLVSLAEILRESPRLLEKVKAFRRRYYREISRQRRVNGNILNKAGRYHLAIQFGWLPIVSDCVKFTQAFQNANKRYAQLIRDEGRWVRRRRTLNKEGDDKGKFNLSSSATLTGPNNPSMVPVHVTQCYGSVAPTRTSYTHESVYVWCEGRCKYFLPSGFRDDRWSKRLMRRNYAGFDITPEAIYNLIPWTWLFDYFTSLGWIFSALSNGLADRVIFDYAYVMRTKVSSLKTECTQQVYSSPTNKRVVKATRIRQATLKSRFQANRFGFGFTEGDLSLTQWGILGALGASKL